MMGGVIGSLTFTAPWMLTGLAALPVIWWLLRLTPPRPQTIAFPPASLMLGLRARDRTPVRSPWWLTLLRMLVAAAIIAALAGPVLKPPVAAADALSQPLLVAVDNGWAAASRWSRRQTLASELASLAEETGQVLYLLPTAGPSMPLQPLSPAEFHQRFATLAPQGFPANRAGAAEEIGKQLAGQTGKLRVAWLSDGVEDGGSEALSKALSGLSADGKIDFYLDEPGASAIAIMKGPADGGVLRARILKAEAVPRSGLAAAVTARGERLAATPFSLGASETAKDLALDLPLDLRNQAARLEIAGEDSAGATYLLDSRSQRRRVGLAAGEGAEDAQPLLSPVYYLERSLTPFAEVTRARTANLDQATADLVGASPSIIILSDVGRLPGPVAVRLRDFVEKGGMLLRFAGPRLEQGGDSLLPAPLRTGGRTLGGAMTWASPQAPMPFEQGSPFEGLAVPKDVAITRQVLSDPAAMPRDTMVWARLSDGTPLVTAAKRGAGLIVFFHITANPDWSNLPISGLFVEMMRKITDLAPLQIAGAGTAVSDAGGALSTNGQSEILKPWRVLDGFGKLVEPGERAQGLAASEIDTAAASAAHPAGFYGPQNALRALNIMQDGATLKPLNVPAAARTRVFADAKTLMLAPWLFMAGLLLFLADGAICAFLATPWRAAWRKAAAILVLGFIASGPAQDVHAAQQDKAANAAADFALQASLETRLAYVVTGNDEMDRISKAGLTGLSRILNARTAVEPGEPMGVDPARDELVFFPLIYWPVLPNAEPLPDRVLAKIDAYMKQGGLIIFDTKSDPASAANFLPGSSAPLGQLLGKLDLPPLQRVPDGHVLSKAFYLLQSFPGRWDNGDPWVEAQPDASEGGKRGVRSDGVSSIIVTSNDLAAAWALDDSDRPMFAAIPGGEEQREMSYRVGVNIVMYALTGNYKADQVHVPAILERLGH